MCEILKNAYDKDFAIEVLKFIDKKMRRVYNEVKCCIFWIRNAIRGNGPHRLAVGSGSHGRGRQQKNTDHAQHRHRRRAAVRAPIYGIDEVGYLTSDTVWNLRELPRRLVLGGGPIGSS